MTEQDTSGVEQWTDRLGDWAEDDPDVLAWPTHEKQPVVADVDGELRQLHSGLVYPRDMTVEDLETILTDLGDPAVRSLSRESHRFDKEMFEWMYDDE